MTQPRDTDEIRVFDLLGTFWTLANGLSLIRLVLVVPIAYLIYVDGPLSWMLGLVFLAGVTDFLDGRVARWSKTVSDWGKVLDPLADKALAAAVVTALALREVEPQLPIWLLALVLFRDLSIVAGSVIVAKRRGYVVMSVMAGKVAVTSLALTVIAAILKADPVVLDSLVWLTAALLVYSYIRYLMRYRQWMRGEVTPDEETKISSAETVSRSSERPS